MVVLNKRTAGWVGGLFILMLLTGPLPAGGLGYLFGYLGGQLIGLTALVVVCQTVWAMVRSGDDEPDQGDDEPAAA